MLVVGLTGNIGSGKSSIARMFKELGAQIIDTDQIARDVVAPGTEGLMQLVQLFGEEVLTSDGSLDRAKTAQIVFNDDEKRQLLNGVVHPAIRQVLLKAISEYKNSRTGDNQSSLKPPAPLLIIEAPLLIETGLYKLVDQVWLITVDKKIQIERVAERDNATLDQITQRIAAQMPQVDKIPYADIIIDNSGNLEAALKQIGKIWGDIIGRPQN